MAPLSNHSLWVTVVLNVESIPEETISWPETSITVTPIDEVTYISKPSRETAPSSENCSPLVRVIPLVTATATLPFTSPQREVTKMLYKHYWNTAPTSTR